MILSRLVTAEGNALKFRVNHTVNGEPYELSEGERYYFTFAPEENPEQRVLIFSAPFSDIDTPHGLSAGKYIFEISVGDNTAHQVIVPALDENNKPLTQLIVLRRIGD